MYPHTRYYSRYHKHRPQAKHQRKHTFLVLKKSEWVDFFLNNRFISYYVSSTHACTHTKQHPLNQLGQTSNLSEWGTLSGKINSSFFCAKKRGGGSFIGLWWRTDKESSRASRRGTIRTGKGSRRSHSSSFSFGFYLFLEFSSLLPPGFFLRTWSGIESPIYNYCLGGDITELGKAKQWTIRTVPITDDELCGISR